MKSSWLFALLVPLVACSGGSGSSPAPVQNTAVSASPINNSNPVGVGVNFWLDDLFPTKNFSGMRSLIRPATSATARTTNLINCAVQVETNASCNFNAIPLIGMEHSAPTVDQIMDRVLVSHDWMATRMRDTRTLSII